jgi:hypothetical protein
MDNNQSRILFDKADYEILNTVNLIQAKGETPSSFKSVLNTELHPQGIKEIGTPQTLRIAVAMMELLGTLKRGTAKERLFALRAVHSETLHEKSISLRHNMARVLMKIMKRLVRLEGDRQRQLVLIHDFRQAASGKPRHVRQQLKNYHLFEMPEEWNQLAFDHHVHDSNSKGRKTPTHLVMDAWIKGVRFLGIIYYNFIRPQAVEELLEAAEIMGIEVRIGVEFNAKLHDKHVQFVWSPMGFFNRRDFVNFLSEPKVKVFMEKGKEVWKHKEISVLKLLDNYNATHRHILENRYGIKAPKLSREKFLRFVDRGQASLVHLAEFVHRSILPELKKQAENVFVSLERSKGKKRKKLSKEFKNLDKLIPEQIVEEFFRPQDNVSIEDSSPIVTHIPEMLQLSISQSLNLIDSLPCRSRITLNPSYMSEGEVLETLYQGEGRITHIEIFNAKDWSRNLTQNREKINDLRIILNNQNVVELKRTLHKTIEETKAESEKLTSNSLKSLNHILGNLPRFLSFYQDKRLRSRMGSDSIGRSITTPGMGMVVLPTLPWRTRKQIKQKPARILPIETTPLKKTTLVVGDNEAKRRHEISMEAEYGVNYVHRGKQYVSWEFGSNTTTLCERGNIACLGGLAQKPINNFKKEFIDKLDTKSVNSIRYINSDLMNIGKIILGFIPAFLTFYLTKSWWFLAWFGAIIWFSITGFRNIMQSVVGGGGLFRTSQLRWKDFVKWDRVSDSLLFTGFSVPLLDFLVKDLLLARAGGITPSSNALLLFSIMALANGIYICSHNIFRGLPLGAVVGNFFRTILSIPVAISFNFLFFKIMFMAGAPIETIQLQMFLWAAVISKFSSDLVAAIIEGTADRRTNLTLRMQDYREKFQLIYANFSVMEMLYPKHDLLTLMSDPDKFAENLSEKDPKLLKSMMINSLDMLYFWMYQPRGETAFKKKISNMNFHEINALFHYLGILKSKRITSKYILEGLVGSKFEKPLAFYLSRTDNYLKAISKQVNLRTPQAN